MGPLIAWTTLTFGLWLASRVISGFEIGLKAAALVALAFGLINWGLEWLLFTQMGVATLGIPLLLGLEFLIRWLAYAAVLKLGEAAMKTLSIRRWAPAFWVAGPLSIVSLALDYVV